jgi:hypothetical protein
MDGEGRVLCSSRVVSYCHVLVALRSTELQKSVLQRFRGKDSLLRRPEATVYPHVRTIYALDWAEALMAPISVPSFLCLGTPSSKILQNAANRPIFCMTPRRSPRMRTAPTI